MSRAEELRSKSRRLVAPPASPASPPVSPASPSSGEAAARRDTASPVVRSRPVRLSVDLAPAVHAGLVQWAAHAGPDVGLSRIPTADVARVLLRRLLLDEDWQRYVVAELRRQSG